MLSAAGVQRSGTPAKSKHPYPTTTLCLEIPGAARNLFTELPSIGVEVRRHQAPKERKKRCRRTLCKVDTRSRASYSALENTVIHPHIALKAMSC